MIRTEISGCKYIKIEKIKYKNTSFYSKNLLK